MFSKLGFTPLSYLDAELECMLDASSPLFGHSDNRLAWTKKAHHWDFLRTWAGLELGTKEVWVGLADPDQDGQWENR